MEPLSSGAVVMWRAGHIKRAEALASHCTASERTVWSSPGSRGSTVPERSVRPAWHGPDWTGYVTLFPSWRYPQPHRSPCPAMCRRRTDGAATAPRTVPCLALAARLRPAFPPATLPPLPPSG